MKVVPRLWPLIPLAFAVAAMPACQGVSTAKNTSAVGTLMATPSSVSFTNVQVGTSQQQAITISNTGGSQLTVTAATTSTGDTEFSTSGLSLPLTLAQGQSATFQITFTPKSAGTMGDTLAVANNGSASPLNIALAGTSVPSSNLATTPASFTFANVQVGTSQSQTETLKNTSGGNLTVSAATISGAGFSFTGLILPLTLASNQSNTFNVKFAPSAAGSSNGTLSLTVNGSSTPVDIALSGVGVAAATLAATPTSLNFASVQVGKTQTQSETIQNTGGSSTTISQATASGTGFSIAGLSTPLTLNAGQTASFSVTFAPNSAGNFNGSVSVVSDASNPTLTVTLSGSGISSSSGQLSVSPTTINVGSVIVGLSGSQTGTLSATGASVTVSGDSSGSSEFAISGLTFPVTIAAGQSVNFTATFTPQSSGIASVTASFTSNASNSPTTATLTGTGTPAPVHTVSLSWTASTSPNITSYNVYRAVYGSSCGAYSQIGSTSGVTTGYTDPAVTDGVTYCYVATAVNSSNEESAYSTAVQAVIPPP